MDMESDFEFDSKDPEAYHRLLNKDLLLGRNRRPGLITEDFDYQCIKELLLKETTANGSSKEIIQNLFTQFLDCLTMKI